MKLKIGENYRIAAESMNFTLEKFTNIKPKDGDERKDWKFVGYYGNMLSQVLEQILLEELKNSEITEVKELISEFGEIKKWLQQQNESNQLLLLKRVNELEREVERLQEVD